MSSLAATKNKENAHDNRAPFTVHQDKPLDPVKLVSPRTEEKPRCLPRSAGSSVDLSALLTNVAQLSQRSADAAVAVDNARSIAQSRQREAEDARRALANFQREAQRETRALEAERDEAQAGAQALQAQLKSADAKRMDLAAEVARLQCELTAKDGKAQRHITRQLAASAQDGEVAQQRLRCEVEAAKLRVVTAQSSHLVSAQRARDELAASEQRYNELRVTAEEEAARARFLTHDTKAALEDANMRAAVRAGTGALIKRSEWWGVSNVRQVVLTPATASRPAVLAWHGGWQRGELELHPPHAAAEIERSTDALTGVESCWLAVRSDTRELHFQAAPGGASLEEWRAMIVAALASR